MQYTMNEISSIFLIDDDTIALTINEAVIRLTGFSLDIQTFESANSALSVLSVTDYSSFPDVIFLDINMPVKDGWEFLDEFEGLSQVALSKCQVYMLSSSVDPQDVERSKTYKSVNGFISKPLTHDKLYAILGLEVQS